MGKIIEAGDLPEGDKVYLKKDYFGYRVVEPWKNPETGKINWFNFLTGGKKNLAILIFLLLLGGLAYMGFTEQISNYKKIAESPCDFCVSCHEQTNKVLGQIKQGSNSISDIKLPNISISQGGG